MNYYYLRDDFETSKSYAKKLLNYNTDLLFLNSEARKILESTSINYS